MAGVTCSTTLAVCPCRWRRKDTAPGEPDHLSKLDVATLGRLYERAYSTFSAPCERILARNDDPTMHVERPLTLLLARRRPSTFDAAHARRRARACASAHAAGVRTALLRAALCQEVLPIVARADAIDVAVGLASLRLPYLVLRRIIDAAVPDAEQVREYVRDAIAIAVRQAHQHA